MTETSLYHDSVKLQFDKGKHTYMVNGIEYPSVTTITGIVDKPALRYWYVNQAIAKIESAIRPGQSYDEVQLGKIFKNAKYGGANARDEAADIGKLVHSYIEKYIERQIKDGNRDRSDLPVHGMARDSIAKFFGWEDKYDPTYIFSERKLLSLEHKFCGTVDIVCSIDGDLCVADLKSSKGVYPEYWLQIAAYQNALTEENPSEIADYLTPSGYDFRNCIIHIPRTSSGLKAHWKEDSELVEEWDAFLGLRQAFRWKEGK